MPQPIPAQGIWLGQVVRGYFNYHAVPTNSRALHVFRHFVAELWRRSLRRRSQHRSLATNDPAIVIGRTRLGAAAPPEVELLLDNGNAIFRDGAWSVAVPELVVFDGVFIAENVHAGDVVDLEQPLRRPARQFETWIGSKSSRPADTLKTARLVTTK